MNQGREDRSPTLAAGRTALTPGAKVAINPAECSIHRLSLSGGGIDSGDSP